MHANETLLELWIEALCAELGELSGAIIGASTAPHEGSHNTAYETALLAQGPVQGEIFVTVEADALVQMTQLASGEPLDPEVAVDADRIESWRRLIDSTANRLSSRLTADYTDANSSRCVILLADTHTVEDGDPLSAEPGSRIQRWLLQAGQSSIDVLARAKIESPEELILLSQQPAAAEQISPPSGPAVSANEIPADPPRAAAQDIPPEPAKNEPAPRRRPSRDLNESNEPSALPHRLDLLLDIELEATLRFGAIEMPLREVLELGPGDVLSLDRHVQEPVELVVGDRIVARGEVVLIGGNFGLHVTEVAEPRRRLETIRCLF
jgi:flagellar motor switch protein FliN/FliY